MVGTAILVAIVLLLFFTGANTAFIVCLSLLYAFAFVLNLFVILSDMKKELNEDDEVLGNKIKFTNKRVKGASKAKFKVTCIVCGCFMFLSAALSLMVFGLTGDYTDYDEYTPLTGKLEYYRESHGKDRYIAIGLYDMPTEYRLFSIYLDEFEYSFFEEVKAGDIVTILVDNDDDRKFSLRGVSKKQWNSFYYLATADKEYFTYEGYVKSHEHNDSIGYIIAGAGIAIFIAAAVTLICTYFVCKKREKEEDIVIYK